jgi:hypothetical protein
MMDIDSYMFQFEMLPFLGVKETFKISILSKDLNKMVDYNKHNHHGDHRDYLE